MKGFTTATTDYHDMAHEAARRFSLHTGLEAEVVPSRGPLGKPEACGRVFSEGRAVWFDADLWFTRDFDFSPYSEGLWATFNRFSEIPGMFPYADRSKLAIGRYFSTAIVVAGPEEAHVWSGAIDTFGPEPMTGPREESFVNAMASAHGVPAQWLPDGLDYEEVAYRRGTFPRPGGEPIAIHALGVPPSAKHSFLKEAA